MRERVLLTGATGMLGAAFVAAWADRRALTALAHRRRLADPRVEQVEGDLADAAGVATAVERAAPSLVVHCAAITDVDRCEREPALARAVHVDGSAAIARAARKAGARMVHVSTDAVFDGEGLHREQDPTAAASVYARSKLEGERAVLEAHPDALVLRTCIVGFSPDGRGLAEWILRELRAGREITGYADLFFTPILADHLVAAVGTLLDARAIGLVHAGGSRALDKHAFAVELARAFGLDERRIRKGSAPSGSGAPRPKRPCLDSSLCARIVGRPLPAIEEGVAEMRRLDDAGWPARVHEMVT